MINKIDFKAKNLTSNAGLLLLFHVESGVSVNVPRPVVGIYWFCVGRERKWLSQWGNKKITIQSGGKDG